MQFATLILLVAALVSGALTVAFVVAGLIRLPRRGAKHGVRAVVGTLVLSAFTAALTVAQLVLVIVQLQGQ